MPLCAATCDIPAALCALVSGHQRLCWHLLREQIDVLPSAIDTYVAEERNRQRHAIECQEEFGLRPFGKHAVTPLTDALLPQAIENDRLFYLAELVMRNCRERRIVARLPPRLSGSALSFVIMHAEKHIVG